MILVVASKKDTASMNIRQQLILHYDFGDSSQKYHGNKIYCKEIQGQELKLVTINEETIYSQSIIDHFYPQLIIYISRHSSRSGKPTLSVHTPGNLGKAEKGGMPGKISIAPSNAMREALLEMARQKAELDLDYQISYECTHHGPSFDVATMFAELGSSPTQWKDAVAAEAVAHATMAAILKSSEPTNVAFGIGGPHYNEKFTRMALEDSYAFGHIVPKYLVSEVSAEIVRRCIARTLEKVETVALDWKGIRGADKTPLVCALKEVEVEVRKV